MAQYRCVCGRIIPERWKICIECREIYGDQEDWPTWLAYTVADNRREYYYETNIEPRLVPFKDEWDDDEEQLVHSEPLITRDREDMYFDGLDALPYAPYNNDIDNLAYRRANNIPERE